MTIEVEGTAYLTLDEVIAQLEAIRKEKGGNLPVLYADADYGDCAVTSITVKAGTYWNDAYQRHLLNPCTVPHVMFDGSVALRRPQGWPG